MTDEQPGVYRPKLSVDRDFTIIPNAWIRNSKLSPSANYLLIYLMTHEIGYEVTFGQMQRETGLGIKGVRSALTELAHKGWLKMERTQRANGQLGPYRYTIIETTVPQSTVAQATVAEGPDNKKINTLENKDKETLAHFAEFWKEYPRKIDKGDALKAFKSALKRTSFKDILAGAIRYAKSDLPETRFVKYPATWLRADAWENHIEPSPDSAAAEKARIRRDREREATQKFLDEQRKLMDEVGPPPVCQHGVLIARCNECIRSLE